MPKTLSILGIVTLLALPASGAETWHRDLAAAKAEAARQDRLLVVDLFAEWCGWCKVLESKVFASEPFLDLARGLVLLRLDVEDGADGGRTQARYEAMSLPTTLILTADGVLAGKIEGFAPAEEYVGRMRREIEIFHRLDGLYTRITGPEGKKIPPEQLLSLARDLHLRQDGERSARLYQMLEERGWADPRGAAMLPFRLADALRLKGSYEEAIAAAGRARKLVTGADAEVLLEAIDLLGIQIATDLGDCGKQRSALKSFLHQHPKSQHQQQVVRSLAELDRGADANCSS